MKTGVGTYGRKVDLKQARKGMRFFFFMPEPARSYGHIDFRRSENKAFAVKNLMHSTDVPICIV